MQSFIITLLICSVTMSGLALFYMAVTPLLAKRYSVTGRYYAWLIVVIGLIIPFRPQFTSPVVSVDLPGNTALPILRLGSVAPVSAPTPAGAAIPTAIPNIPWWQIGAAVWLAGMLLFLACHLVRHYRFLKLTTRWSETVTDGPALALFQELKTQMDLPQSIGLWVCGSIGSPMLIGS